MMSNENYDGRAHDIYLEGQRDQHIKNTFEKALNELLKKYRASLCIAEDYPGSHYSGDIYIAVEFEDILRDDLNLGMHYDGN